MVNFGTDAATPLAALPAMPRKPLAANPSAAPAIADSAATDAPPVTAPNPIEVAKLTIFSIGILFPSPSGSLGICGCIMFCRFF